MNFMPTPAFLPVFLPSNKCSAENKSILKQANGKKQLQNVSPRVRKANKSLCAALAQFHSLPCNGVEFLSVPQMHSASTVFPFFPLYLFPSFSLINCVNVSFWFCFLICLSPGLLE